MRDLDREFVKRALAAGWITEREERAARRAVAKAHKRGQPLYVAQALVQLGALDCEQLLELGRELGARLYECPRCGHKLPADELPAADESFACARCERTLACDHDVTLSLAEVLTSRDPLDLSVTLADRGGHEGSGSTSASSSLPPFDLERFELKEELGRGAYGVVFRAVQTDLEREVALKVLRPREGELSPVALERFLREGASVARLQHENVIRVFGIGRHKDLYVLNMELVRGQSLKAYRKQRPDGRLPWEEALEVVRGILRGIEHAHAHGVVHRDLKPANVLIEENGTPRVIDFGLAKDLETDAQLTQGSAAVGSPAYLSPEQLEHGSSQADARCDVFSVGVILYELLAGARPWKAKTRNELFLSMLRDAPAPLPEDLDLPSGLTEVVFQMLARDPDERLQSAALALEALELEGGGAPAQPARRNTTRATRSVSKTTKSLRSASKPPKPLRAPSKATPALGGTSRGPLLAAAAGVVVLGVLFGALRAGGGDPEAVAQAGEVAPEAREPEPLALAAAPEPPPAGPPPEVEPEPPVEPQPPVEPEPLEAPEPQPVGQDPDPPVAPDPAPPEPDPEPAATPDPEPAPEPEPPAAPPPPGSATYAVVRDADSLNLREGPGASFPVVRVAQRGEWLRTSGVERGGWVELILSRDGRAWASARYLELSEVPLARDPARPELDSGAGDPERWPRLAAHDHDVPWHERAFEINRLAVGARTGHVLSGLRLALRDPNPLNRAFALRGLRRYPRELLLGVGSQGLVEGLIEALEERHEPYVPEVAGELLQRLAGDRVAREPEGWRTWWSEAGAEEARALARGPLPVPAAAGGAGEQTRVRELSTVISRVRKQGLEMVFLLDVTKSMGEELSAVKAQVREIVSLLSLLLDPKKVRLGFVAYGDEVVDAQPLIPPAKFPDRLDEIQIFDDPQDKTIEEGISVGLLATFDRAMKWGRGARRRVVLLLADAPPLDPEQCRQIVRAAAAKDFVLSALIAPPPEYAKHKPPHAILEELAQLGGGEAAPLGSPEELLVHILTLAFGPSYVDDLRLMVHAYREVRPQPPR